MKNILILRHAKSDWSSGLSDIERPLNSRGQKDAPFMGTIIKKLSVQPDIILSSPAKRARQTAEAVAKNFDFKHEITFIEEFYHGNHNSIINNLQKLPSNTNTVLVVGHNPTLEELVSSLTSDGSLNLRMPTATLVLVNMYIENWQSLAVGNGTIEWVLQPKVLKSMI